MFNWFSPNAVKAAKDALQEFNDTFPTTQWKSEPKFIDNGEEYTLEEFMKHVEGLKKENKELKDYTKNLREQQEFLYNENKNLNDLLKSIEEDGTEEHNKAVDLRQSIAHLRLESEKFYNEVQKLKAENAELKEKLNDNSNVVWEAKVNILNNDIAMWRAKNQIIDNNYKKCSEERDEFKHQLNAANKEIEILKRWKEEMLVVLKQWDEVDQYIRNHEDTKLGEFIAGTCLHFLKERDELKKEVVNLKEDIVDYVIKKDNEIQELKRTEKYYVCNHCGYKVAHDTNYWGGCGFCKDGLMIEKEEEQKHPMYPIHWGGYEGTASAYKNLPPVFSDETKEVVESLKEMKTQGFEDYDPRDFVEPIKEVEFNSEELLKRVTEYAETTAENLEEKFDKGEDVLDYFEKPKWKCPCNKCKEKENVKTWEEAASDLALRVVKLEEMVELLKAVRVQTPNQFYYNQNIPCKAPKEFDDL